MRGVIMHAPGDVRVEERDMPKIVAPTDAIIKLAATCICGSDLWPYRGAEPVRDQPMGHEYVGTVTEVGADVTSVHVSQRFLSQSVALVFLSDPGGKRLLHDPTTRTIKP